MSAYIDSLNFSLHAVKNSLGVAMSELKSLIFQRFVLFTRTDIRYCAGDLSFTWSDPGGKYPRGTSGSLIPFQ